MNNISQRNDIKKFEASCMRNKNKIKMARGEILIASGSHYRRSSGKAFSPF